MTVIRIYPGEMKENEYVMMLENKGEKRKNKNKKIGKMNRKLMGENCIIIYSLFRKICGFFSKSFQNIYTFPMPALN